MVSKKTQSNHRNQGLNLDLLVIPGVRSYHRGLALEPDFLILNQWQVMSKQGESCEQASILQTGAHAKAVLAITQQCKQSHGMCSNSEGAKPTLAYLDKSRGTPESKSLGGVVFATCFLIFIGLLLFSGLLLKLMLRLGSLEERQGLWRPMKS